MPIAEVKEMKLNVVEGICSTLQNIWQKKYLT